MLIGTGLKPPKIRNL